MFASALSFFALSALAASSARAAPERLNVLGWGDYVDSATLENFAAQTGVDVVYDSYGDEAEIERKLRKPGDYDVAIVPAARVPELVAAGLLRPLDLKAIPNAAALDGAVMGRLAVVDPGPRHALPYLWFMTGLSYDAAKSPAGALDPPSWDAALRPDRLAGFADCGVHAPDAPEALFPLALRQLRLDPASARPIDLRRAADLLAPLRRAAQRTKGEDVEAGLASGEICLAVTTSLVAAQATRRAREGESGAEVRFVPPREGAPIVIDALVVPVSARRPGTSFAFVNYLLRPQTAARVTNATRLANAAPASKPWIASEIAEDPAIYPPPETAALLYAIAPPDAAARQAMAREWARAGARK